MEQQHGQQLMNLNSGYGHLWKDLNTKVKRDTIKLSPARPEFVAPGTLNAWFQFNTNKLVVCDVETVKSYHLWNLQEKTAVSLKFAKGILGGVGGGGGVIGYDPAGGDWNAPPESFEFVEDVAMSKSKSPPSEGGIYEPQSSIVIWHIPTGRRLRTFLPLQSRRGWISDLHMDPYKIVVGVNTDRYPSVRVLDLETGLCFNSVRVSCPVDKLRFDSSRLVVSCREGILVWDMRMNGGLGEERNRPIIKLPPPKYQLTDLQLSEHKIGYCGNRQVVLWDERVATSGKDTSPYPGYTFYEHKEYPISSLQFDDSKVVISLLDGTGSVDLLEPFLPSSSSSFVSSLLPHGQTQAQGFTSMLKTFRKLAYDVEEEKKKLQEAEAKAGRKKKEKTEKEKQASLIDKLRIGSRPTITPSDQLKEEKRVAKLASLQATRSSIQGIPSVGMLTYNSVQYDDQSGIIVSGGGDGFIHVWRINGGSSGPLVSSSASVASSSSSSSFSSSASQQLHPSYPSHPSYPASSQHLLHPSHPSHPSSPSPFPSPQQYPPTFAYPASHPFQGSTTFQPPSSASSSASSAFIPLSTSPTYHSSTSSSSSSSSSSVPSSLSTSPHRPAPSIPTSSVSSSSSSSNPTSQSYHPPVRPPSQQYKQ